MHSKLLGIVTSRDVDFMTSPAEREVLISSIMTTDLVVAQEGISLSSKLLPVHFLITIPWQIQS